MHFPLRKNTLRPLFLIYTKLSFTKLRTLAYALFSNITPLRLNFLNRRARKGLSRVSQSTKKHLSPNMYRMGECAGWTGGGKEMEKTGVNPDVIEICTKTNKFLVEYKSPDRTKRFV